MGPLVGGGGGESDRSESNKRTESGVNSRIPIRQKEDVER